MKFGLIIQGPIVTFGDGPNNVEKGFDARESIRANIAAFGPHVAAIVLSTWSNENIVDGSFDSEVKVIKSEPITDYDFGNQRKQFYSSRVGAQWLNHNTDCTHYLKIRTDQVVPVEIINWLKSIFSKPYLAIANEEHVIVFSDAIKSEFFYVGDFIFSATKNDYLALCNSVMNSEGHLHPVNGVDYLIKYLSSLDAKYRLARSSFVRSLLIASHNLKVSKLWVETLNLRVKILPQEIFSKIVWRGRGMEQILPSLTTAFLFDGGVVGFCSQSLDQKISIKEFLRTTWRQWKRYWKSYFQYRKTHQ